jgi:hypothetical protein
MTLAELLESVRRVEVLTNRDGASASACRSRQPWLQFRGVARAVKYGKDCKRVILDGKIDGVFFEAPQTDLLSASVDSLEKSRIYQRAFEGGFDFQFEFLSQPGSLRLVPSNGLREFGQSRRFESDRQAHFQPKRLLKSASTCSHGTPSRGFFSKSARRRSSSAASSGVSSTSPYFSQTIATTSCRSAGGKCSICSRISAALMGAIYSADLQAQDGVSAVTKHPLP